MTLALIPDEVSHDPFTAFELAGAWGIRHFEIRYAYRWRVPLCPVWAADRTAAAVKACGVSVTAISPGIFKPVMQTDGSSVPVNADTPAEIERHIREHLPRAFEFAAKLGTRRITLFALAKPAGTPAGTQAPAAAVDTLGRAAAAAAAAGFELLLENGGGTWADSGAASAALLAAVGSDALRLTWDPANVAYAGLVEDPVGQGYAAVRPFARNVHVKDAAVLDGKPHWVPLGTGCVDWPGQLRRLRQDGYDGCLTLEPHLQYESPVGLVARVEAFVRQAQALAAG